MPANLAGESGMNSQSGAHSPVSGVLQSRYWRYISSILQWAGLGRFDISWFINQQVATGGLTGDQQVIRTPAFHLLRPEFSYGDTFSGSRNFLSIISRLCILALRVMGSRRSDISLYVRIIAHGVYTCVVLRETEENFEKALGQFRPFLTALSGVC